MVSRKSGPRRVYVRVNSDFDATGYMQPRSITWADGRTFQIDAVRDFRPASRLDAELPVDCYTIEIRGELKQLFFVRSNPRFAGHFGRWFVECGQSR